MRVVCAPDSFKHSMSAVAAAEAMARGVRAALPGAECVLLPLSDGGEGFTDAVAASLGGHLVDVPVTDALGRPLTGRFALAGDLAALEVASAVGLQDIADADRDIWRASSRGVGTILSAALDAGATRFVVGLGGSATNDGGAGMLAALGARFLDAAGRDVDPSPSGLRALASVDLAGLDPRLAAAEVVAAADVDNPLLGPRGASAVFGPQKGASPADVPRLDAVLRRLVQVTGRTADAERPGSGAAGGLGFALISFLGATLRPGIEIVAEAVGLAGAVASADLVLSGEGSVDAQTLSGKAPAGVAALARAHGKPLVLFAGRVAPDAAALLDQGVTDLVAITPEGEDLATALAHGVPNLERAVAAYLADRLP